MLLCVQQVWVFGFSKMLEVLVGKFLRQAIFSVCRLCARGVAPGDILRGTCVSLCFFNH